MIDNLPLGQNSTCVVMYNRTLPQPWLDGTSRWRRVTERLAIYAIRTQHEDSPGRPALNFGVGYFRYSSLHHYQLKR